MDFDSLPLSIFTFLWAVAHQWWALVAGTGAMTALGFYERWKSRQVSWRIVSKGALVAVLVAFYMAWQDEHKKLVAIEHNNSDPVYGLPFGWMEAAPSGITPWAGFPAPALKAEAIELARQMIEFENAYKAQARDLMSEHAPVAGDATRLYLDRGEKLKALQDKETLEFRQKFQKQAIELIVEMLERKKMPFPVRPSSGLSRDGDRAWGMGILSGDSPVSDLAAYLNKLANAL